MPPVAIRPLLSDERELLVVATLGNLNWPGERFTRDDITGGTEFVQYTLLVPDRGDFGFVAEAGSAAVGVVWLQFHPRTDAGYGFVDETTPELSVWVRSPERGRGIGRALLCEALREAGARRLASVSLSVEVENPAKRLYAGEGFADVPGRETDGVMLWGGRRGAAAPER